MWQNIERKITFVKLNQTVFLSIEVFDHLTDFIAKIIYFLKQNRSIVLWLYNIWKSRILEGLWSFFLIIL